MVELIKFDMTSKYNMKELCMESLGRPSYRVMPILHENNNTNLNRLK